MHMYLHFEFMGNIGKTYSTIMFSVKTIAYSLERTYLILLMFKMFVLHAILLFISI